MATNIARLQEELKVVNAHIAVETAKYEAECKTAEGADQAWVAAMLAVSIAQEASAAAARILKEAYNERAIYEESSRIIRELKAGQQLRQQLREKQAQVLAQEAAMGGGADPK